MGISAEEADLLLSYHRCGIMIAQAIVYKIAIKKLAKEHGTE